MSDYSGPGIYEIIPQNAQDKALNCWTGSKSPGTQIKLYQRENADNSRFEIVAAGGAGGKPETGDREYHLIAVHSGLYVTANNSKVSTTEIKSPKDASIRWKLVPAGNGSFNIRSVAGGIELNVAGSGTSNGTDVITWPIENNPNSQFFLKAGS